MSVFDDHFENQVDAVLVPCEICGDEKQPDDLQECFLCEIETCSGCGSSDNSFGWLCGGCQEDMEGEPGRSCNE